MSWKERAVHFATSKPRNSLNRQESIDEPMSKGGKDAKLDKSGVVNLGFSQSFTQSFESDTKSAHGNGLPSKRARSATAVLAPFQMKTCAYFFESAKRKGYCHCGRLKESHKQEAFQNLNVPWDKEKHVKSYRTNGYGEVEFHGTNRKTRAKYIRVSNDTNAQDALKLLLKEWKLEFPNFLVSVTGGAKTFKLPMKLKQLFSSGLYKVAQTTGAWVITGGTNTGVMKHVGEALQIASKGQYGAPGDAQKRVYCIGVATWGIVEHRHLLSQPVNGAIKYYMTNSIESEGACLDNNHTHFFLVDNGTENQYGAEINFRARLENQIMKMEVDKNRGKVPAILLVLEGGPNTVATVHAAISQDPPVPVIVIKDSGRAADLLAYAHNISHGEGSFFYMGDVVEHKQLFKKIEQMYPELDQKGCLRVYANILKCVERKHLITIFKMEERTADLDLAILTALLKSKSTSLEDQLKLALIWDRPDIARAQIFNEEHKWPISALEIAMKDALEKDRTEFVELLLERGVNMGSFLTHDRLDSLYSIRARKRKSMLRYMVEGGKGKLGTVTQSDAENEFYELTGLSLNSCYSMEMIPSMDMALPLCDRRFSYHPFKQPFNHLFVWAVLNNMQSMALCFWKHGEEAMAKALLACKLYFAMAKYAEKRDIKDDIIEMLKANGEQFQKLAVDLLDHCFITDEQRSSKLMTYELKNWGNTTNLSLAVHSGHTLFVAHSCNQELLTDIWGGVMTFRTQRSLKTVLCMFCPPFILALGFRSKKEIMKMPQTEGSLVQLEDMEEDVEEEDAAEAVEVDINEIENDGDCFKRNSNFTASVQASHLSILSSQKDADTVMSSDVIKHHSLKWWEKFLGFYTAPITKFWGNVLAYLVFLGLFTYVLLGKFPSSPSTAEYIVIIFVISLTTEEIRQVLKSDNGRLYKKIYEWSRSKWNLCDGLAIFLFYTGLALRLNQSTMSAGRVVLAIDIMFWIIRLLDIFSVNHNLGPYVVIIGKMTIDLAYFLFIMAVFLLAYGVARQTILEPNKPVSWHSVAEIFFVPYFQVYGELFIDKEHLYSSEKTYLGTKKYNDHSEPIVSLLMAFYLLIANILLLNLLIAIFNNTFAKVQVNSNQIWKFQRYHLILEYARRPPFIPPFVFINHVLSVLKWMFLRCRSLRRQGGLGLEDVGGSDRKIKIFPTPLEMDDLMQFEEDCLTSFLRKRNDILISSREEKMRILLEKVENIAWQVGESKRENFTKEERMDTQLSKLQQQIEELSKSVTDNSGAASERHRSSSGALAYPSTSLPRQISMVSAQSEIVSKLMREKPPMPRRFLSHNPYMHMPAYKEKSSVKEAAWNFRKSSLKTSAPSKTELMRAYNERDEESYVGEDTVDGPAADIGDDAESIGQNSQQRQRSLSYPSSSFDSKSGDVENESDFTDIHEEYDTTDAKDINLLDIHIQPTLHVKARTSPYPASGISRFPVPDIYVNWSVEYPEYNPPEYVSSMLDLSNKVDQEDPSGIQFNTIDNGISRISSYGPYEVINERPRNPFGRTGITGRGLLGRWGPNHATEAIVTRWKRNPNGEKFVRGKFSLEFLALKKKEMIIPGELVVSTVKMPEVILRAFKSKSEERFDEEQIEKIFSDVFEVSRDFDDARNTDNAWLETTVLNYHDETGAATKNIKFEHLNLLWIELDSEVQMTAKHKESLARIALARGANY